METHISEGIKVIDVDAHWIESPDLWTSRAPAKYRDQVPYMREVDGKSVWYVKGGVEFGSSTGIVIDVNGVKRNSYGEVNRGMMSIPSFTECDTAAYVPKDRLELMDRTSIWAEMLYPQAAGFSAAKFMSTFRNEPELELECIKIYNDAAAELQQVGKNRLFPLAMVPVRNMDAAAREMRRCIEDLKITGFVISDNLTALGLPDYNHPYWEPFWEAASALDAPLNFHTGGTLIDATRAPWKSFGDAEKLAMNTTAANMTNAAAMANILMSGIHDRYPKVKLVSVESGIGWVPYFLEMLDHNLEEMVPAQMRRTRRKPSEYFREHWWACFWFEECALQNQVNDIGVDKVMFETDYPHPTCLYPDNEDWIEHTMRGLGEYTVRRILQDNAVELYKLPMPAKVTA